MTTSATPYGSTTPHRAADPAPPHRTHAAATRWNTGAAPYPGIPSGGASGTARPVAGIPGAATRPERRYATSGVTMLLLSLLATGLVAGVYFAFQVAVIPGLARASAGTYVEAMDRINESIENPAFFAAFFGALVVTAVAAAQQWRRGNRRTALFALIALGLYVIGFGATIVGDIPLNEQLAAAGTEHPEAAVAWFQPPWLAWNVVRTLASAASLLCLGRALVLHGRSR
ncbi:MAG TPA: anthrone oxygenase family protein [Actinocatenispora sp.]